MKTILITLLLLPLQAVAWTDIQPGGSGTFTTQDSSGSVTQVVPGPGDGYTAYGPDGFTVIESDGNGGTRYYGTEGRQGFITPGPDDGFTVYDY